MGIATDGEPVLSEAWKASVREWIAAHRRSMTWLADQCGITAAAVSAILMPEVRRRRRGLSPVKFSKHAITIAKVTGIPLPHPGTSPLTTQAIQYLEILEKRNPAVLRKFVAKLERYTEGLMQVLDLERALLGDLGEEQAHDRHTDAEASRRP